ncbi:MULTISPECIES: MFS transporter [Thalassobaculum]|uniref:Predicted arabinose efflux permease, MFS family n=1 Tax=Thalassobaculum litoreum DSM 18839 TaxID=1123362 RepID=A0A8G2EUD6_9PROT|nr:MULTISPECIES: MFS transporter [Thalassobaculum]SDF28875.1 Predicted arabinose efflux permease, MFS family [Thalassobaculum litoreum DSM 18839]
MALRLLILVLCAGSIMGIAIGFRQGLGLYLPFLSDEFGGRETFALAMGLMNLCWGLGAPIAGAIADRYGPGRVAAAGGLAYALGLWLMVIGGADGLLAGGVLIGLGLSGSGFTVLLGAVGRAAPPEQRGKALGLAAMGGSLGQFLALPYVHFLIDGTGWQTSLLILAASALLIVPLALGTAGRPAESPDGQSLDGQTESGQSMGDAFSQGLASRDFWLLNSGFFVCGFHLAFVAIHLPAYLSDRGFEHWLGAAALTVIGFANIIGSYVCGALGDRYMKKNVLAVLYLIRAAVFAGFLILPMTPAMVLVLAGLLGLTWLGTVPLTSGLVGTIFGIRYMSMMFGLVFVGHQIGSFLGAWIGGVAFDVFQSYDVMWQLSVALGVLSAVLHWPIREVRLLSA